jgi:AcrR family transcriptional regulator
MPKLLDRTIQKNRREIERAALSLFTRQGFHGTTVREIADKTGVSIGNIYNYYKNKEEIFVSLTQHMGTQMMAIQQEELLPLMTSMDPASLKKLAVAIGRVVSRNLDYWRLMYIDVVEFRHKHFIHNYRILDERLRQHAIQLAKTCGSPFPPHVDAAAAYAEIYLHIITYFLVEKLFRAKRHLGRSEEEAIDLLVSLYTATGTRPRARAQGA